jgi:asparagine synthase (glutamine-hydrolysing)
MCGIAGCVDLEGSGPVEDHVLDRMAGALVHRGPDSSGRFRDSRVGLAFRRLSIIDLETGDQPLYNEDGSLVVICNGEIFNHRELRRELESRGHVFSTRSDVEVLLHLYEEHGVDLLRRLNGQFAFALYDRRAGTLLLARDHFGICPLYYTVADGSFVFASEVKAILEHPSVPREVDLTGLDQVFSFPGLVSPRTMFRGVHRLGSGHYLLVRDRDISETEYWDLVYPRDGELPYDRPESYYVESLAELFSRSVRYRLQADVPVGFYLSGGLDSSLTAAVIGQVAPDVRRHSFSITFADGPTDESRYQRLVAEQLRCERHEIRFDGARITDGLERMIYHCETPVKETYNVCMLALSAAAREHGIPVVLVGQGADELFAGYPGYRFDRFAERRSGGGDLTELMEGDIREELWGDRELYYEKDYHALGQVKQGLYSDLGRRRFAEFDCLGFPPVDAERLQGRHRLHQRSYLDFKLRLCDHLLLDHGDRMALANSVEGRYPFLDVDLVELATRIPPHLKLNGFTEKYALRKMAEPLVPGEVLQREKFGWRAAGSPELLQEGVEWIRDMLSYQRIKRQGYFDPDAVEALKTKYVQDGFKLNFHFEDDLLMIVATFGVFLDVFRMPVL